MGGRQKSSDGPPEILGPTKPGEPFEAGADTLDRELETFLRALNQRLGWIYPVEFPHIPMGHFTAMVALCVLDRAAPQHSLEERAERAKLAPKAAETMRGMPTFAEVRHAVEEAWDFVAQPKLLPEHVSDPLTQHKLAQRTVRLALHAGDPKVSVKALEQMNDRAMPVQTQKAGERPVLMLTAEVAALIGDTLRMMSEPKTVLLLPSPPSDDG